AIWRQDSSIRKNSGLNVCQHFNFADDAFAAWKFSWPPGAFPQRVATNPDGVKMLEYLRRSIERVGHVALCPIISWVARASPRPSGNRFVICEGCAPVPRVAPAKTKIVHRALAGRGDPGRNRARERP